MMGLGGEAGAAATFDPNQTRNSINHVLGNGPTWSDRSETIFNVFAAKKKPIHFLFPETNKK